MESKLELVVFLPLSFAGVLKRNPIAFLSLFLQANLNDGFLAVNAILFQLMRQHSLDRLETKIMIHVSLNDDGAAMDIRHYLAIKSLANF